MSAGSAVAGEPTKGIVKQGQDAVNAVPSKFITSTKHGSFNHKKHKSLSEQRDDAKVVGYSDRDQAKTTSETSVKKTDKVDCNDEDRKEESKNCDDDSDLKVLGFKEKAHPAIR